MKADQRKSQILEVKWKLKFNKKQRQDSWQSKRNTDIMKINKADTTIEEVDKAEAEEAAIDKIDKVAVNTNISPLISKRKIHTHQRIMINQEQHRDNQVTSKNHLLYHKASIKPRSHHLRLLKKSNQWLTMRWLRKSWEISILIKLRKLFQKR